MHPDDEMKNVINQADGQNKKQLNVEKFPNATCECGNAIWVQGMFVKKIPGIELGELTNEEEAVPISQFPVLVCAKCGKVAPFMMENDEYRKAFDKFNGTENTEE